MARRIALIFTMVLLVSGIGAAAAAGVSSSSSAGRSALLALDRLPQTDFPASLSRAKRPDQGVVTFSMPVLGVPVVLSATLTNTTVGQVGTLSRSASAFVVRITRQRYRVSPIKLPDGLEIASQTLRLDPNVPCTIRIDRHRGTITSNIRWLIHAPNTLYNGSHTIRLADKGQRRILSLTRLGHGRYRFAIRTHWHTTVKLASWSVAGTALPGAAVNVAATYTSYLVVKVKPTSTSYLVVRKAKH